LEGCGEGVELAVKAGSEAAFRQGLIVLAHANDVRISGIELHLPQVPASTAAVRPQEKELSSFQKPIADVYANLFVSIGIRPLHCAQLEIDPCLFHFTVGPATGGGGGGTRSGPSTGLVAPAKKGDRVVQVRSVAGFSVGQRICIDVGDALEAVTIADI